jgi:hypothetical protein
MADQTCSELFILTLFSFGKTFTTAHEETIQDKPKEAVV